MKGFQRKIASMQRSIPLTTARQRYAGQQPLQHLRQCSSSCPRPVSCPGPAASEQTTQRRLSTTKHPRARVTVPVDGQQVALSPILLRDLCQCPACVHVDTRQRLYSTADIPAAIQARAVEIKEDAIHIKWANDTPGFDAGHTTSIPVNTLQQVGSSGVTPGPFEGPVPRNVLWSAGSSALPDFPYEIYIRDDATVYEVIKQLKTHGLAFVTGVPGREGSVAGVGERIGPIRDTFYGRTWDVRTVPKAINAAYTSGDLGFHTDLLYFRDPPHLQLLHCIQSSSKGGASVFADAFKAAVDLYETDREAFDVLATTPVTYHYEHPGANLYAATKPVIDMRPLQIGDQKFRTVEEFLDAWDASRQSVRASMGVDVPPLSIGDCLEKINWGPPFLAPPSLDHQSMDATRYPNAASAGDALSDKMDRWHAAAAKFGELLTRPENLHERLMKPGECVIFDNTRALHARRAFDSEDVGKARWLRGTYVDRDPYYSKLRVLHNKLNEAA